jgi:hypothetical protein
MADNQSIKQDGTTGTNYVVAADENTGDGNSLVQYVKLMFGADGTFTRVSAAEGLPVAQSANPCVETTVAGSATSVTLLAANANRTGWRAWNDGTAIAYIHENNETASSTNWTLRLQAGEVYESAQNVTSAAITVIWASATGTMRITEWS